MHWNARHPQHASCTWKNNAVNWACLDHPMQHIIEVWQTAVQDTRSSMNSSLWGIRNLASHILQYTICLSSSFRIMEYVMHVPPEGMQIVAHRFCTRSWHKVNAGFGSNWRWWPHNRLCITEDTRTFLTIVEVDKIPQLTVFFFTIFQDIANAPLSHRPRAGWGKIRHRLLTLFLSVSSFAFLGHLLEWVCVATELLRARVSYDVVVTARPRLQVWLVHHPLVNAFRRQESCQVSSVPLAIRVLDVDKIRLLTFVFDF